jgi:hypothetical protein
MSQDHDPYHEGERAVQDLAGERAEADQNARVIGPRIPRGALAFLGRQRLIAAATRLPGGGPVASLVYGEPGFVSSSDGSTVELDLPKAHLLPEDELGRVEVGDPVALLALELESRRRLRVNGRVVAAAPGRVQIAIAEAYPNCPKYIQRRRLAALGASAVSAPSPSPWQTGLAAAQRRLVEAADTFFVATAHPERGVDVSHRGGRPGFVRILEGDVLEVPDYPGNSMFNSLGNVAVDPRAALAFLDFATGEILELRGRASLVWGQNDGEGRTGGTGRFWRFAPERARTTTPPVKGRWVLLDSSPYNP